MQANCQTQSTSPLPKPGESELPSPSQPSTSEPSASDSTPSVYVVVPAYDGKIWGCCAAAVFANMLRLRDEGVHCELWFPAGESHATRLRDLVAAYFLASKHTHLMMIDSDIEAPDDSILRLLRADKPIVGVPYPLKSEEDRRFIVGVRPQDANLGQLRFVNGLAKVRHIGTGFLMVRREVFETMAERMGHLRTHFGNRSLPEDVRRWEYDFFGTFHDPETGMWLSEDYAFCARARWLDYDVWAVGDVALAHWGSARYFNGDWLTFLESQQ